MTAKPTKDPRGGPRPGAGRKQTPTPRVSFTCRISPDTRARIDALKERNIAVGPHIDTMIAQLCDRLGITI